MHARVLVRRLFPLAIILTFLFGMVYAVSKGTRSHPKNMDGFYETEGSASGLRVIYSQHQQTQQQQQQPQKPKTFRYETLNWLLYSPEHDVKRRPLPAQTGTATRGEIPTFKKEDIQSRYPSLNLGTDQKNEKWIVLTTIQAPTDDVKFLAGLEGWKVVVVGDTKTPGNWSWPNCHYIDVKFQEEMGLRLPGMLAYKSYSRKNVGYLYAIAQGAKVIYETDDDNRPFDKLANFQYGESVSGLMFAGSRLFNAYQYFGQSTLWQRGFPLGKVGGAVENAFRVSQSWATPIIQQGVVNGDPDVDAVFRLTRKFFNHKLDVTFDPSGPPVIIPPGVFSPTNTQNTLFRYEALWSLFIPTSLNFRTCDIWRGYVAQRLVWEIGGYQAFYPPNAVQIRNNHDLMMDMSEEKQMYFTSDDLLEYLYKWTCPQDLSFFQCVYKLMVDLVDAGNFIFAEKDIEAVKVWIEDIMILGYEEPRRVKSDSRNGELAGNELERLKSETLNKGTLVFYASSEQKEPTISWQPRDFETPGWRFAEGVSSLCPQIKSFPIDFVTRRQKAFNIFHDILLVIYTSPDKSTGVDGYATIVKNLEFYYRSSFPNIAYCGHDSKTFLEAVKSLNLKHQLTFIQLSENFTAHHVCVAKALQMNYNVAGYITINDDVILDLSSLADFNKDKIFMTSHGVTTPDRKNSILQGLHGKIPYENAVNALSSRQTQTHSLTSYIKGVDQFVANNRHKGLIPFEENFVFYVPRRLREKVEFYSSHFGNHNVLSQISVPAILKGIGEEVVRNGSIFRYGLSRDTTSLCNVLLEEIKVLETDRNTPGVQADRQGPAVLNRSNITVTA